MFRKIGIWALMSFSLGVLWGLGVIVSETQVDPGDWKTIDVLVREGSVLQDVVETFQTTSRAKVHLTTYKTQPEMLAYLSDPSRSFDVVSVYCHQIDDLIEKQLLSEIDFAKIPNIENISSDFQGGYFDLGGKHSVAISWGVNGFIYNSEKVKDPIGSWRKLSDKAFARKVSLIKSKEEVLSALNYRGAFDVSSLTSESLDEFLSVLKRLSSQFILLGQDVEEQLKRDELWIAQVSNGKAARIMESNPKMKFFVPEEGATIWIQNLVIPKNSKYPELAHKFINYSLDKDVALATVSSLKESSANVAIEESSIPSVLKPSYLRELQIGKLSFAKNVDSQKARLIELAWSSLGL